MAFSSLENVQVSRGKELTFSKDFNKPYKANITSSILKMRQLRLEKSIDFLKTTQLVSVNGRSVQTPKFHYGNLTETEGNVYRSTPKTQNIIKLTGHGTSKMTNTVMTSPLNNRVTAIRNLTTVLHFCLFFRFPSVSKGKRSRRGRKENLREKRDWPLTWSSPGSYD